MARAASLIRASRAGIFEQRADRIHQPDFVQLSFPPAPLRRRALLQRLRIAPLMIVRRPRKRNKNRRLPRRRNLRDRARARAAQHQVRAREKRRHIVDKTMHFRRQCPSLLVRRLDVIIVTLSGLMDDANTGTRFISSGNDAHHCLIDRMRALASAKDQQSRRGMDRKASAESERMPAAPERRSQLALRKYRPVSFKVNRCRRNKARHHAIGESRHEVRFERQRRYSPAESPPASPGRRHIRRRRSRHRDRNSTSIRRAAENRARKIEDRLRTRRQAHPIQRAHFHQLQRKSGGRNQPVLNASRRADKQHFGGIAGLQFLGDGERGNDVSAGASARQNCLA